MLIDQSYILDKKIMDRYSFINIFMNQFFLLCIRYVKIFTINIKIRLRNLV